MKIEDLKETAGLARLGLENDELGALLPDFERMLDYFAVMEKAAADGVLFPGAPSVDVKMPSGQDPCITLKAHGRFRLDMPGDNGADSALNDSLVENAGERDGRFMVIPNVL